MSLTEQTIRELEDKAVLLIMLSTAKGKEQTVADIIKAAVIENGAKIIFLARIDKITPELSGK